MIGESIVPLAMAGVGLCIGAFFVASQAALLDEMRWGKSWLALGGMQGLVLRGTPGLALGGTLGLALEGGYLACGELPFEQIMHAALTDSLSHTIVHQSSSQSSCPQDLAARQNT